MFFSIALYIALAIFVGGLIYKIGTWFSLKIATQAQTISPSQRLLAAVKGIVLTILSAKILTLIKVFFLDIILQRKVFQESRFRWLIHILIYGGFMFLVLMHALDPIITVGIFPDYAPTLNPFLFLRDLFGVLVIVGVILAVYRRYILKAPRLTTTTMDTYALIILAVIIVSGIILEGTKITSYTRYQEMVNDYAGLEEGEDDYQALTAFWVKEFSMISPDITAPFDSSLIEEGREIHEMSCAGCHSKPQWGFGGFLVAKATKGISLPIDRAHIPSVLWYIHFLACFIGLAYLPFSKFLHIITSPLSLLANSVMSKRTSYPVNIATRQALEFDACMHCGQCTGRCSVGIMSEALQNVNILPSEKIPSLKKVSSGKEMAEGEFRTILEGAYVCTNCHRCTDVCPAGINLEDLWFNMREEMFQRNYPLFFALSPLSFYRGLMRETMPDSDYERPLDQAREAIIASYDLMKSQDRAITLNPADQDLRSGLLLSDQANTFQMCFGCQTCTNVCPVVANYENPKEVLGMLPHEIMYAAGLGIKDLAFGSRMLWDCTTCYQCQEQCPQGVRVTEVLYELKNLAIANATTAKG
ncbi:MAG: 4Fe-4S dicluster domain-containing protein [Deltaproteobacteria bacterium]|nr:4Fe-4S dicluster domain-containing protein [Deltaproteobacteria bacterium]